MGSEISPAALAPLHLSLNEAPAPGLKAAQSTATASGICGVNCSLPPALSTDSTRPSPTPEQLEDLERARADAKFAAQQVRALQQKVNNSPNRNPLEKEELGVAEMHATLMASVLEQKERALGINGDRLTNSSEDLFVQTDYKEVQDARSPALSKEHQEFVKHIEDDKVYFENLYQMEKTLINAKDSNSPLSGPKEVRRVTDYAEKHAKYVVDAYGTAISLAQSDYRKAKRRADEADNAGNKEAKLKAMNEMHKLDEVIYRYNMALFSAEDKKARVMHSIENIKRIVPDYFKDNNSSDIPDNDDLDRNQINNMQRRLYAEKLKISKWYDMQAQILEQQELSLLEIRSVDILKNRVIQVIEQNKKIEEMYVRAEEKNSQDTMDTKQSQATTDTNNAIVEINGKRNVDENPNNSIKMEFIPV
jgi:hypothetical protein